MSNKGRLLQWLIFLSSVSFGNSKGILYPKDSESRVVKCLDGMWNFRADFSPSRNQSFQDQWYSKPLSATGDTVQMPVPSSYNDITTDKSLRDFVGWVWYDREFFLPKDWEHQRILLRFGSVHYLALVWVNGKFLFSHDGGHLPFEGQINSAVNFDGANRLTVAVNNTLTLTTLPAGSIEFQHDAKRYPTGYFIQKLQMDFFNYAGIHRHVHLYTTPQTYLDDITILTNLQGTAGVVDFQLSTGGIGTVPSSAIHVSIQDRDGKQVGQSNGQLNGTITIPNARLWWPYTMQSNDFGYLYTLLVNVSGDVYRQKFGIRTVQVTDSEFLINNKPFYCLGVGKHEDADFRGKGLDYAVIARDFQMLKWLGSNCFRTSHYPYAEEIMDQTDFQGIVVIDECPGVGLAPQNFGNVSLAHHKNVMAEMIQRDKNRPSVVMWSVANEPASASVQAEPYFKEVIAYTKSLDKSNRPVTFASAAGFSNDKVAQFVDVLCINRYFGWYSDTAHTEIIYVQIPNDLEGWRAKYKKPMMISEYGADTVPGVHTEPSYMFTEEFQTEFLAEYHKVFDKYRGQFLVGEMVWNFADFMTGQDTNRVVGNRKGILTRQRQPKYAGHLLRARYHAIANITIPKQRHL